MIHKRLEATEDLPMPMHRRFLMEQQKQLHSSQGHGRDAMTYPKQIRGSSTPPTATAATATNQEGYTNHGNVLYGNPVEEYFRHLDVLSAPWWVRLAEGDRKPQTRRAHSATILEINREEKDETLENDEMRRRRRQLEFQTQRKLSQMHEYMIVTGGFTDSDWKTFPVWAYDMTLATTSNNGRWFNLTPPVISPANASVVCRGNATKFGMEYSQPCGPTSRVGHISVVRDGALYVFGGLQYNDGEGVFFMEDNPYMYKMELSEDEFEGRDYENYDGNFDADVSTVQTMYWKRWIPKVNTPVTNMRSTMTDDLVYSVNRGEVRGGYWEKGDKLIIYGGLHVRDYKTSTGHRQQADTTLGDVWAYDFKTDTWDMIAATWGLEEYSSADHPGDRTSHAATVVGDELVVYGGLRKVDIYLWDGSTIWSQLDDIWVFNLNTREWKQRPMAESIGRAYHSVVGWQMPERDGTILTSFGGYKMVLDPVDNQPISYVYDDTMVSMPQIQNTSQPSVWYVAAYSGLQPDTISTRLEHTAVLSRQYGNMFIWGGRYEKTADISGMWSLNVAGDTTTVEYMVRSEDTEVVNTGLAYVILLSVMMMSMMLTYVCGIVHRRSETEATNADALNADPTLGGTVFGRNGLGQDIIDTLPLKKYQNENVADTDTTGNHENEGNMDMTSSTNLDAAENDDEHCCPICLVEYEVGDDIRCLPCKHEFHKSCVDPWLANNASCPACRHSLSDLVSLTTSVDNFVQSIRATLNATTTRRTDSTREPTRETPTTATSTTEQAIAPGVRGLQNLGRILTARRFNLRSVPSNDSMSSSRSRVERGGTLEYSNHHQHHDNGSVGDLELSYNASLELSDSMDSGISQESFDSGDIPIEGRPRRMRMPQSDRRRNRGTGRGRRVRRVRGLNRSTNLDAPLRPTDASIV
jgi:hypothetical protein